MTVRVLAGRYELVRFVGRGGMGEVWEGRDRVIGRRVAIKLLPHDGRDIAGAELFQREARTAGALNHPGVVTVHDFGQDAGDGSLFLVMEFLVGRDLGTVLYEDGTPPVAAAVDWAAQAAAALARAHEVNVVHRDLKPANLMLTPDGHVKILDFGIARFMESLPSSRVMGTFPYMPPERFGGHPGDVRSDLYSLGCVLYELLTGQVPFHATSPASVMSAHLTQTPVPPGRVRSEVPASLDDLVMELLAKAPEDRPVSAAEVCDRLRGLPPTRHSGTGTADAATDTADSACRDDAGDVAPAGPAPPAPSVPGPDAPTLTADPPEPDMETPPRTGFVTRRRALWLGVGAVAAGAGMATGLVLRGDRGTSAGSGEGFRPWFEADGSKLSAPVADDGVVYISGKDTRDGTIYALNRTTGATQWSRRFKGEGYTIGADGSTISIPDPVVADGVVYVHYEDAIHALDAATGAKKWEYTIAGIWELKLAGGLAHVYVQHEKAVHALDAATGTEKWVSRGIDSIWQWNVAGKVHAYIDQGNVQALDAATGRKKWDFTGLSAEWLWTAGGMLYTHSNSGVIYALDAATGKQKWKFHANHPTFESMMVADGTAYVIADASKSSIHPSLHALDAATGTQKWTAHSEDRRDFDKLKAVDGTLYVNGFEQIEALNTATGGTKWRIEKATDSVTREVEMEVATKVMCVNEAAGDPHVQAHDAATGRKTWTSPIRSSALLIAHGVLYVTSENQDAIYALNTATGASPTR
jgi:eukaryotic-like serine/threonine-protein kinase